MSGYIKLFREIKNWEWYKDLVTYKLFTHLLISANHEDGMVRGIEVKRGQYLTSRQSLAVETGLSEQSVRTAMAHLQLTNELTIKSTKKYTIVTIENYSKYQGDDKTTNQQVNQQTNRQINHKQEDKNIRTIKNTPTVYKKDPADEVVEIYHECCPSLPKVIVLSDKRKSHIKARLKKHSLDEIRLAFQKAEASDFLTGRTKRSDWKANIDWLMGSETNLIKVLEDNYVNHSNVVNSAVRDIQRMQDAIPYGEYEALQKEFNHV